MKPFLADDFFLETETAKKLFLEYAKDLPIFDYHCHLSAQEIAENKRFRDMTELWLDGDHYKWRVLRANGIDESFITGNAPSKEKFMKWAQTVSFTIGNPLYHWSHLELKRYFSIDLPLNESSAEMIWNQCNELLLQDDFTARRLIERSNVRGLCTTDDPLDDLTYHKQIEEDSSFNVIVLPTFRPDGALEIEKDSFRQWVASLKMITKKTLNSFSEFVEALEQRVDYFHQHGCRLSDHGLDSPFYAEVTEDEVDHIYLKALKGEGLSPLEVIQYKTALLKALGMFYAKRDWAMQLHIGAIRSTNTKKLNSVGPHTGFDSIADFNYADDLAKLLDSLDLIECLPKTIIYNLNPRDNYMIASMVGNFQESIPGKIQYGTAWWFNDQKNGIEDQLRVLANTGLLPRFIGMLTDSRSFISYPRHEYFRRIVCNLIGNWVENGEYPADFTVLKEIIQQICYDNVLSYLGIDVKDS